MDVVDRGTKAQGVGDGQGRVHTWLNEEQYTWRLQAEASLEGEGTSAYDGGSSQY